MTYGVLALVAYSIDVNIMVLPHWWDYETRQVAIGRGGEKGDGTQGWERECERTAPVEEGSIRQPVESSVREDKGRVIRHTDKEGTIRPERVKDCMDSSIGGVSVQ
jgi:hypothetical protein